MHETIDDHEARTISIAASWLSSALDDLHHAHANTTRMLRLFHAYDQELDQYMEAIRRAWSVVVGKMPELRNPIAYYFTVLEGEIMPDLGMTAAEVERQGYHGK